MTRSAVTFAVIVFALSAEAAPVPTNKESTPAAHWLADQLPPGAVARLGSNRFRAPGGIDNLAVSPDGKFVATSGAGGVTVFDAAGRPVARLNDLLFNEGFGFAADNTLLTLGLKDDGTILMGRHDPATGRPRSQVQLGDFANGSAATFSPDGSLLVVIAGNELRVYHTASGLEAGKVVLKKESPTATAFSADGRWLGVGTEQNRFLVFDRLTGGEVCRVKLRDPVVNFAFAPDGKRVAVAGSTNTISLIDVPAGTKRKVKVKEAAERVAFTGAGELLVHSGASGTARVVNTAGKELRRLRGLDSLLRFELTPDGKTLVGGTTSGTVMLWDMKTGKRLPASAELPGGVAQLFFPAPGRLVGFAEGVGWLGWDVATGAQQRIGPRVKADMTAGLSADAKRFAAVGPKGLYVLDAATEKTLKILPLDANFNTARTWFSPDGKEVYAWGVGALRVWDLGTGKSRDTVFGGKHDAVALDVSPDGSRLAVALQDPPAVGAAALVRVFDLKTGKQLYDRPIAGTPSDVTFTPDGTRFAVFHRPLPAPWVEAPTLQIHIHDAATGRVLRQLAGYYTGQQGIPFSPDGRVIALTGMDGTVRLLEVASGKDRATFAHSPYDGPEAVAFSPDGLLLATAGGEVPVYAWDLRGRRERRGSPPPDAAAAERLWQELGSDDAAAAYAAVKELERHPAAAVRLLRGKLRPAGPIDAAAVAKWVAALDSPAYRDRVAAERELVKVADRVVPALRAAAARTASAEVREQLTRLLDQADRPTPDVLRVARAVETLEYAGTADAKALLGEWVSGAAGARLTTEAAAAVKRMH